MTTATAAIASGATTNTSSSVSFCEDVVLLSINYLLSCVLLSIKYLPSCEMTVLLPSCDRRIPSQSGQALTRTGKCFSRETQDRTRNNQYFKPLDGKTFRRYPKEGKRVLKRIRLMISRGLLKQQCDWLRGVT